MDKTFFSLFFFFISYWTGETKNNLFNHKTKYYTLFFREWVYKEIKSVFQKDKIYFFIKALMINLVSKKEITKLMDLKMNTSLTGH